MRYTVTSTESVTLPNDSEAQFMRLLGITWTDATTPRTDRPVRFIPSNRYRQAPPVVKRFPGDSFTMRWA